MARARISDHILSHILVSEEAQNSLRSTMQEDLFGRPSHRLIATYMSVGLHFTTHKQKEELTRSQRTQLRDHARIHRHGGFGTLLQRNSKDSEECIFEVAGVIVKTHLPPFLSEDEYVRSLLPFDLTNLSLDCLVDSPKISFLLSPSPSVALVLFSSSGR